MNYSEIINKIPEAEKPEILRLLRALDEAKRVEASQEHYLPFVREMWPGFIDGRHHKIMADAFERVVNGSLKRLIINMPPRHTKSEFASYLLPAWFLGKNPGKKVIQTAHTAELAVGFGRKVRNLVGSDDYQKVFPGVSLQSDSKAAGRWSTNKGGEYFAIGVGGAVTGKGADLLIIDDPHALEITTPIPTPNGFVEIQDLKVGDEVFGPDGKPTKVVAKSDVWHDRDLYSVVTSDGEEILCDGGHLWGVNSDTCLERARVESYAARYLSEWPKMNKPVIPRWQPVEYPEKNLPIDPWVLGAWLGDGTSSSGRMTAHPDDQPYVMGEFRKAGYEVGPVTKDGFTFTVYGLMEKLRGLGVLNNKHIPEEYLTASVEQRMALLQGLVDTDGSVSKVGQCGFYNCNEFLVRGVVEILHSLGVKAQMRTYNDRRGKYKSSQPNHRVMFRLQDAARMPRKAMYTKTPMDKRSRSISVEPVGASGSVQCITVDREDGLFLCGRGYVVTHNSEQEAMVGQFDGSVYDKVFGWYSSGPRQRLQPGGAIVIVMTRWAKRDLTGQIINASTRNEGSSEWEVIELPAIMPSGDPLWPEFWSIDELQRLKIELPISKWSAQYQQDPTSEEGALIKRDWWNVWEGEKAPVCDAVIIAMDTAFSKTERSDYSACVTFGVFNNPDPTGKLIPNLILLDAWKDKMEFPELKAATVQYHKEWQPDMFIVEKKASGAPLIAELRNAGIPVQEFTPTRATGDKIVRVNAITDIFASGVVWAPDERFAEEVVEECAAFPSGDHDDYVDAVTMALMRFRQGGFMIPTDEDDEIPTPKFRKEPFY
jgi:predicted phage terminase large subunit-like protein